MALGDVRRNARANALEAAAQYAASFDWSNHDEYQMSEDEYAVFMEECKKLSKQLEIKAEKIRNV